MNTEPTPAMSTPDPTPEDPKESDDGGAVGSFLQKMLGKSWKTTAAGLTAITCSIIVGVNAGLPGAIPPIVVVLAGIIGPMVGGVGLMMAKDHNVSGGTKVISPDPDVQQPTPPST